MSARPTDTPDPPEPPLVESTRAWLAESRLGEWAGRHRTLAATLVAVLVAFKSWRWLVLSVVGHGDWLLAHWTLALAATGVIALIVFVSVRLGLGWFTDDDEGRRAPDHTMEDRLRRARAEAAARHVS